MELAQLEVEELLAPTPFAGAAVLPVSSTTGQGVPELKGALVDLAAKNAMPDQPDRPARLPVDRAFHLKGLGVVVTGTLGSGAIRPADTLEILPRGERVRVRSVQVHGQPREQADGRRAHVPPVDRRRPGGSRARHAARRAGAFETTTSLLARFTLLPDAPAPVRGFVPVRLHLYASEVLGRMRPLNPEGTGAGGDRAGRDPPRRRRFRRCEATASSSAAPRRPRLSAAARSSIRAGGATAAPSSSRR